MLRNVIAVFIFILSVTICLTTNPCSEGPQVEMNPLECCALPDLVEPSIMMNCFSKWGEQTKRQSKMDGIPRGCCVAECATNATKLVKNGKINRKETQKIFLASSKNNPQWQSIVKGTLDECFAEADANKEEIEAGAKLKPSYKGEKICHPISGHIIRCMRMKMFNKCPENVFQENNQDCIKLRQYHAKCPLN
uniref:General odorant-binding protein 67 n=1 Tax=Culex pipiens TaxID=7175 RepID=A0A8D8C7Z1_CULPI